VTIAAVSAAGLIPFGAVAAGLFAAALVNVVMLVVNLLPVAPMDGYALFRSVIWAETGSRVEAERRAIEWSRVVLVSGLSIAVLVLAVDRLSGVLVLIMLTTLTAQHHLAVRAAAARPA
jgi:Zn-dependent protease